MKNNILATFVTYKKLYNDKNTDVYDIISEFARYIILKEHKPTYQQALFPTLLVKYFDFKIPILVLKPAIKRIEGVTLENKEYKINYDLLNNHNTFTSIKDDSIKKTEQIISDLINFISIKAPDFVVTEESKEEVEYAFRRFILDEASSDPLTPYISAFIIEKSADTQYTKNINLIREGHILYNGLCQNDDVSSQGWKDELTIYLDTEIIFHLAGYNGTTFQQLANEFLELISAANKQRTLIHLRYFPDTKVEIENFFTTAETLFSNNSVIRPDETAMISILKDCKASIDITNKCNSLFYFLEKNKICLEAKNDFYAQKYIEFNLESKEYVGTPEEKNIRLLSNISKLRGNNITSDYSKSKAILISETSSVLDYSRIFTQDKQSLYQDTSKNITSLAVNLYTITNILWYKLNRSLHGDNMPSTINSVIRAQIVLSKYVNESITEEYDKLMEQFKKGNIDKDEIASLILGMRRHSSKPESIIKEGVDDALALICEKDINKFKEDFELSHYAHEELKKEHENTLKQLASVKEDVEYWKSQTEIQQKKGILYSEQAKLENLKEWLTNYTNNYNTENTRLKKSIKRKTIFTIALYVIYYIVIVICIINLGWNLMEPITYVLSIPPIIIPFIIKMIKPDLSLKVWIHSYENKETYSSAKRMLETYQEKVTQQEALVNKLTLELTK